MGKESASISISDLSLIAKEKGHDLGCEVVRSIGVGAWPRKCARRHPKRGNRDSSCFSSSVVIYGKPFVFFAYDLDTK